MMNQRRQFLISLLAAGLSQPRISIAQSQSNGKGSQLPVRVSTLNHVSFGCADLRSTVRWYGRVFGMAGHAFLDYGGGPTVLRIGKGPGNVPVSPPGTKAAGP